MNQLKMVIINKNGDINNFYFYFILKNLWCCSSSNHPQKNLTMFWL